MRQADFACKEFANDSDPQGENKEYIRESNLVGIGQLVRFPSDFVHGKSQGEYDSSQTEQHHWKKGKFTLCVGGCWL